MRKRVRRRHFAFELPVESDLLFGFGLEGNFGGVWFGWTGFLIWKIWLGYYISLFHYIGAVHLISRATDGRDFGTNCRVPSRIIKDATR
mmetsp:Transcript_9898/g.13832  ORF Transcript_9898/g.13832 Transcript_9898/m.13832 type:complete len:89 (-) Transcript_9898:10-276(-)